jgi:hypothetical protein
MICCNRWRGRVSGLSGYGRSNRGKRERGGGLACSWRCNAAFRLWLRGRVNRLDTSFCSQGRELRCQFLSLIGTAAALDAMGLAIQENGRLSGREVEVLLELCLQSPHNVWLHSSPIKPNVEHAISSSS